MPLEDDHPFKDDPLVQKARKGMDVEADLAGSATWRAIREQAKEHEHEWVENLIACAPTETDRIGRCMLNIYAVRAMEGFIMQVVEAGHVAVQQIETEDSEETGYD